VLGLEVVSAAAVLMASADSIAALCAQLNLPEGAAGTSTIEAKTNFFTAVRDGVITITASPLHGGGSTIVVQTECTAATAAMSAAHCRHSRC
jgi:acyl-coenzyme A thioesterase PaaI-like protein